MPLVKTLRVGEGVSIGSDKIWVRILDVKGKIVRVIVEAPRDQEIKNLEKSYGSTESRNTDTGEAKA